MLKLQMLNRRLTTRHWTDYEIRVYECILTSETKYSYLVKDKRWYVCRWDEYVYIHYCITTTNNALFIDFKPSHSPDHIDIP